MSRNHLNPIQTTRQGLQAAAELQPIALRSMFWRPDYLERSEWLEHIPVAFWLAEAHQPRVFVEIAPLNGSSYFAFCQAVDRLGLDTRCFAVGAWKSEDGDGDAAEVARFRSYGDGRYPGFSRVIRGEADEILAHFTDGTVDLLHIDGRRSYRAIRQLFAAWRPKLSARALVVLHKSNVHESSCGVHRLVQELAEQHPVFEFAQGEGLVVVGMGGEQGELLSRLFEAGNDELARKSVHEVFSRLGRACVDSFLAQAEQARSRQLADQLQDQHRQLDELRAALERSRGDAERVALLQELRGELKDEVARLQARLESIQDEVGERALLVQRLAGENADQRHAVEAARRELAEREQELAALRVAAESADSEQMLALREELDEAGQRAARAVRKLADDNQALAADVARLTAALRGGEDKEALLVRLHADADRRSGDALKALRDEKQALATEVRELTEALLALKQAHAGETQPLRSALDSARHELEALKAERGQYAAQLAATRVELAGARGGHDELAGKLAAALDGGKAQQAALDALRGELQAARQDVQALQAERASLGEQAGAQRRQAEEEGRAQLAASRQRADDEAKALNAALGAARAAGEQQQAAADAANAALQAAQAALEGERRDAAAAKNEHRQLAEQLRLAMARIQTLEGGAGLAHVALEAATAELAASRRRNAELDAEVASLAAQLAGQRDLHDKETVQLHAAHRDVLARHAEDRNSFAADAEALQARIAALEAADAETQARARKLAVAFTALRTDKQALDAELARMAQDHAAKLAASRAELQDHAASTLMQLKQRHARETADLRASMASELARQTQALAKAEAGLKARFEEIARLTGALIAGKKEAQATQVEMQALRAALASARADGESAAAAVAAERRAAAQQQAALQSEAAIERGRLLAELAVARREAAAAATAHAAQAAAAQEALAAIRHSRSWRLTAPLRAMGRPFRAPAADAAPAPDTAVDAGAEDARLLRESDLFDADWYRTTYPDIADAGADPVQHYLAFGAAEGRNPGPGFDTLGYLGRYHDVAAAGINPLVHFLRNGRDEGRQPA